jgi:hypothetical protein
VSAIETSLIMGTKQIIWVYLCSSVVSTPFARLTLLLPDHLRVEAA